jgi:hypothetical protein
MPVIYSFPFTATSSVTFSNLTSRELEEESAAVGEDEAAKHPVLELECEVQVVEEIAAVADNEDETFFLVNFPDEILFCSGRLTSRELEEESAAVVKDEAVQDEEVDSELFEGETVEHPEVEVQVVEVAVVIFNETSLDSVRFVGFEG